MAKRIKKKDVRPGDWAMHKGGVLDDRQVAAVDHKKRTIQLIISGDYITSHLPIENYTFVRGD